MTRLRKHLSPATVLSTIALFAALGGGYAMAFAGSGTLQKGSKINLGPSFTSVRTLTGIGDLQANCGLDVTRIRFHNSSSETLVIRSFRESDGASLGDNAMAPGGDSTAFLTNAANDTFRFYILPEDGSKSPQADIVVYAAEPADDCGLTPNPSRATALVLNTQQ